MPYNFAADSFRAKKNFVTDFLRKKFTFPQKNDHFAFLAALWETWRQRTLFILGSLESP